MTNYDPGRKVKFRHPTDPHLYLCWKCKQYKTKDHFPACSGWHPVLCLKCRVVVRVCLPKCNPPLKVMARVCLPDSYMISCWSMAGVDSPTQEMIKLKREQILLKRQFKKLKKWRKENDPTIADVPRIEPENETADECA